MRVARKKIPLDQLGFFIITSNERITTQFPKKSDTASLCIGVHWSVNTEALCFKWPRVAVWLLGRSVCVPPRRSASQSGPTGFPFHFLLCALGGAHKRARAHELDERDVTHTPTAALPRVVTAILTRFTYSGVITVPVPTRISAETCLSCLLIVHTKQC